MGEAEYNRLLDAVSVAIKLEPLPDFSDMDGWTASC
jgi:hypothetical protein